MRHYFAFQVSGGDQYETQEIGFRVAGDEATVLNVTLRRLPVSEATEATLFPVESTFSTNPFISSESSGDGLPVSSTSSHPERENENDDPPIQFDQQTTPNAIYDFDIEDTNEIAIHADPVISSSAPFSFSGDGRLILFTACTFFHLILLFLLNPHNFSSANIHN